MDAFRQPENRTEDEGGGGETTNNNTWWEPRSEAVNITITFFFLLIIVAAMVGNIAVILAVFLYHRLKEEAANLFLVNLSVTDLSSAAVVIVSSTTAVMADRWVLGSTWCLLVCGANYCLIIVSMLTLCFISLDRHVAINLSLRYSSHVTRPRVLLLIAYTWLQGIAFGLAPVLYHWIDYDYWELTCAIQWHRFGDPVLIYVVLAFILCFLLPGVVLTVAYGKVLDTAKRIKPRPRPMVQLATLDVDQNSLQRGNSSQQPPRTVKYSESSKAVRSLLIVVMAYFICMTPFSVTKLYKVCVPVPQALPGYASVVATFFQFLGSAVNPFVYGLFRRDFQKAFLYLLWKVFRYRNSDVTTGNAAFSRTSQ